MELAALGDGDSHPLWRIAMLRHPTMHVSAAHLDKKKVGLHNIFKLRIKEIEMDMNYHQSSTPDHRSTYEGSLPPP